jgi:hypothetical protein
VIPLVVPLPVICAASPPANPLASSSSLATREKGLLVRTRTIITMAKAPPTLLRSSLPSFREFADARDMNAEMTTSPRLKQAIAHGGNTANSGAVRR